MRFEPGSIPFLFHGTSARFDDAPRPGGYDGVFWTAEHSTVAQSYISRIGGTVSCWVEAHQLDRPVRPTKHDPLYLIAKSIGPVADEVTWDNWGHAISWRCQPGCITYRQVCAHIEEKMGYKNTSAGSGRSYEITAGPWDPKTETQSFVDAGFKRQGTLLIIEGFQGMSFLDISLGEPDLQEVQYHSVDVFRRAEQQGYDGVIIDDFTQSKSWGNVGHRSIGFFAPAIARLTTTAVPALRYDWEDGMAASETSEFLAWRAQRSMLPMIGDRALDLDAAATQPVLVRRMSREEARDALRAAWDSGKNADRPKTNHDPVVNDDGSGYVLVKMPLEWIRPNEAGERYDGTVNLERARQYREHSIDAPIHLLFGERLLQKGMSHANVMDGGHRVSASRMDRRDSIAAIMQESQLRSLIACRLQPDAHHSCEASPPQPDLQAPKQRRVSAHP
jgi:hypothetical protein